MITLLAIYNSGVARGGNGGGPPRAALFGGGKIEVIPKKKKIREGEKDCQGVSKKLLEGQKIF